jgi:hypothetical protein
MAYLFNQYLSLGVELAIHALHMREQLEFTHDSDLVVLSLGSFRIS